MFDEQNDYLWYFVYCDGLGRLYLYLYLFVFICCAFVLLPIFSVNKDLYISRLRTLDRNRLCVELWVLVCPVAAACIRAAIVIHCGSRCGALTAWSLCRRLRNSERDWSRLIYGVNYEAKRCPQRRRLASSERLSRRPSDTCWQSSLLQRVRHLGAKFEDTRTLK